MPSPTIYSFTLQDDSGVKASHIVYVAYDAATETIGALTGNLAAYGGLLDAITDAKIIDARIIIDVAPDPSWKAAPVTPSDVERTGLFDFNQANSKYVAPEDVPAMARSKSPKDRINLADADVAAYITNVTQASGIGGSHTVFANSKFLNALQSLRDAAITFRKHRRSLSKVSFETP